MRPAPGLLAMGLAAALPSVAQDSGWLEFSDGNRISGHLQSLDGTNGQFHSDRFGPVEFSSSEAKFVKNTASASNQEKPSTPLLDPSKNGTQKPASGSPSDQKTIRWWLPDSWSIAGACLWKEENEQEKTELDIELALNWRQPQYEISASVRSEYEYRNGSVISNEQNGRLRWIHDLTPIWFVMMDDSMERDSQVFSGSRYDYVLTQAAFGGGIRLVLSDRLQTRLAVNWNLISIDILDSSSGGSLDVFSLYAQTRLKISQNTILNHWARIYFWEQGSEGIESETELAYRLDKQLSYGLRHVYWKRRPNLQGSAKNELKLFVRFTY